MPQHRLYAVFYERQEETGVSPTHVLGGDHIAIRPRFTAMWAMTRSKRAARSFARAKLGLCVSMPLPGPEARVWDAPTFRMCADKVEFDFRPEKT